MSVCVCVCVCVCVYESHMRRSLFADGLFFSWSQLRQAVIRAVFMELAAGQSYSWETLS